MAAANASPRAQRLAVLGSPVAEFVGWRLAIDCGTADFGGERAYAVAALVATHKGARTIGQLVQRLRCHRCGRTPLSVYLEIGPEMATRARFRRVALIGPDDPSQSRNW